LHNLFFYNHCINRSREFAVPAFLQKNETNFAFSFYNTFQNYFEL
jgi:hypothetical protein